MANKNCQSEFQTIFYSVEADRVRRSTPVRIIRRTQVFSGSKARLRAEAALRRNSWTPLLVIGQPNGYTRTDIPGQGLRFLKK